MFLGTCIMHLFLTVFLLVFAFNFMKMMKKKSSFKGKTLPSPPKLPFIGNLHQLGKLPHQNLSQLSREYGPAMMLYLGSIPTLVISSPEFAKQILKTHDTIFCSRPRSPGAKRIFYNLLDVAFSPYDDHWRYVRKLFVSHLMSSRQEPLFSKAREIEMSNLIDYLSQAEPNPVNIDERTFELVGGIVGTVAFGESYRGKQFEGQELKGLMDEAMLLINSFSVEDFFPLFGWVVDLFSGHKARLDKCFHKLDGYLEMMLDEHLERKTRTHDGDVVDVLIELSKDDEHNDRLSRDQIKAILLNVFLGGVDTTAIAIVWAMCELIRNPRVMKKAQAEIRGNLGAIQKLEVDDLGKLKYLKMIIKETLRLHPSAPLLVPRECMRMCQICGENGETYDICPGTRVLINAWEIGRDPNSWARPNEFYPERFYQKDVNFTGQHFQYLPFGGGRRICPGITNSTPTIEYTLANLLYWFDWEVAKGMEGDVVSLEEEGGVTVHKRTHLSLVPKKCTWH